VNPYSLLESMPLCQRLFSKPFLGSVKMGLRPKFLILLLSFSIVPLIALSLMHQRVYIELGDDISTIAKVLLLQTAAKDLRKNAENFSDTLGREFYLIENLVTICGEELKNKLTANWRVSTNGATNTALGTIYGDVKALHQKLASLRNDIVRLRVYVRDIGWISYPEVTD
jgi:hypothetical protein